MLVGGAFARRGNVLVCHFSMEQPFCCSLRTWPLKQGVRDSLEGKSSILLALPRPLKPHDLK